MEKAVAQRSSSPIFSEYGLAGKNEWESLQCDVFVDTFGDLKQGTMMWVIETVAIVLSQFRMEQDPIKKEERKAKLIVRKQSHSICQSLRNTCWKTTDFFVGSEVTWCDFVFAVSLESFETIFGKSALDQYPALKGLKSKVYNIPSIAAWVAKRPATEL
ncbi:hypothetical protein NQ317_013943 [Molorchus minor]|uniref:glutathione transferase n=1 Tax=Molorchus minor TaxID=1323400 RepID=A0ABQ9JUZ3_9CUCU|nr:hypothetical protein NQ317_013943 [Molorchus minor]